MDPIVEQRFLEWYRETVEIGMPTMLEHAALRAFRDHSRNDVRFKRHTRYLKRPPWRDGDGMDSGLAFLDFPPFLLALRAGMTLI